MTPKVRLVKCPKCLKLLPEPKGVPIYSCGGCGAILRAKHDASNALEKESQYSDIRDEKGSNLQSEEEKDLSSSNWTGSVESNAEEMNELSDKICSSDETHPPIQEPNTDQSVKDENSGFVEVRSEKPEHDGFGKSLETENPNIAIDSDSNAKTDSYADEALKASEESATNENLELIPVPSETEEGPEDETEDQFSNMNENASIHVSKKQTTDVPSVARDSVPSYTEMSSKSISSYSVMEKPTIEAGFGHPTRFRTRLDGDEGPSSRMMRNSMYSSTSYPKEMYENVILPQDKEELLRMVIELETQLKRMRNIEEEKLEHYPYLHDPYGPTTSTYGSWDSETVHDDRVYGFQGSKSLREKARVPKRYVRPIAGACPMIACYRCAEILQIPEDFLVSGRKRFRWLRCGGCSIVLRFSIQDRTHIAPYPPELDKDGNSIHGITNSGGIPTSVAPTLALQGKADYDQRVSYGSSEDFKSGIEEGARRRGSSALHQLMGYNSVTQMLR